MTDQTPPDSNGPQNVETRYLDRRQIRKLAEFHAETRRHTPGPERAALDEAQQAEINTLIAGMTDQEKSAFRSAYAAEKAGQDETLPGQLAYDPYAAPQTPIRAQAKDFSDLDPLHAEAQSVLANARRDDTAVRWLLWACLGVFFFLVMLIFR